jgi:hypothetical protein
MSIIEFSKGKYRAFPTSKKRYLFVLLFLLAGGLVGTPFLANWNPLSLHSPSGYSYFELVSLFMSLVSLFYYLFHSEVLQTQSRFISPNTAFWLAWTATLALHFWAANCVYFGQTKQLVLAVLLISAAYAFLDLLIGKKGVIPADNAEYLASFLLADLPAVIGLAIVFVYTTTLQDPAGSVGYWEHWKIFVGGATTLLLIVCNTTFFLIQFELHLYKEPKPAKAKKTK